MAYVLGYFAADGSMIKNKRGGYYVEFTTTDRVIFQKICKAVGSNHKISKRPRNDIEWKQQYRLQFGSRSWFSDLGALGFTPNKSKSLTFPEIPGRFIPDFIRGYFDGDGCVYFRKLKYADRVRKRWILQTLFTSGSQQFLSSLHACLRNRGIAKGVVKKKLRGFELAFSHRDSLALYQLMYNTVSATDLCLPRKYQLLKRAIRILYPHAGVA